LCAKKLKGFEIDDQYGKLEEFAVSHMWSDLVRLHNDPENDYHISLHDFCVICRQNLAEHDVLRMNLTSL
jgi:hypothetical protein